MHATVDIRNNSVVIIGPPASGKTYLSKLLHKDNPGHKLYHTDDYIKYGYVQSLYAILEEIRSTSKYHPVIVEGIQGYRLLRKGVELDCFYPDMVIELEITEARMFKTYETERGGKSVGSLRAFNKAHATILSDYKSMKNPHPPQWIKLKNSY